MLVNICHALGKGLFFKPVSGTIGKTALMLFSTTEKVDVADLSEKMLVKAMWAAVYHYQIFSADYKKNTQTYLLKHLRELTDENGLQKIQEKKLLTDEDMVMMNKKEHNDMKEYMRGYFLYGSAGPILNKSVFHQFRFIEAISETDRVCFYPTEVTHFMFGKLHSRLGNLLLTGQRGTGKSFSIALYYYLNQPIVEAIIQQNRNKQNLPLILQSHRLKLFYWTIGDLKKSRNVIAIV